MRNLEKGDRSDISDVFTESRMRENGTLRLCYATASQAGSMRNSRPKTAKSVLRISKGRAGVPDEGRLALP